MESFMDALGAVGLFVLIVIGVVAGLIASALSGGRNKLVFIVIGVLAAVALPFLLAALGIGIVVAGGLLAILVLGAVGAIAVVLIARALFR